MMLSRLVRNQMSIERVVEKGNRGLLFFISFFFFSFLYHIFVVKVQEIAWSASYAENKTQKPKRTNKGNIRN